LASIMKRNANIHNPKRPKHDKFVVVYHLVL
jgi:hypothetical protein